MAALRTQIYLTPMQRHQLDRLRAREGKTLAELVREALDDYLAQKTQDPEAVFAATFGTIPDLEVPSRDEWDRGYG